MLLTQFDHLFITFSDLLILSIEAGYGKCVEYIVADIEAILIDIHTAPGSQPICMTLAGQVMKCGQ